MLQDSDGVDDDEGPTRLRRELRAAILAYAPQRLALDASSSARALDGPRWSLLDAFDADGEQYIVARRAEVSALRKLTKRERELLVQAGRGAHNKLIAYTLGISHATVRVLIARAAKKLGVQTRAELVARFVEEDDTTDDDP